jgi:hypothetical protein
MKFDLRISNFRLWIFIALIIKGIFFWLRIYLNYDINQPLLGYFTYDSHEYYDSMNNFYETGVYSPDVRMPGLGVIFLFLRTFFERNTVLNIILIIQWFVSSSAIYVLSLVVSRMTQKKSVFYFVFFLIILTHYVFTWDVLLLTECFCISFFVFSLFYLQRFLNTPSNKFLFLSGFFLTWCVFLRPVFFLFYGIIAVFLLFRFIKQKTDLKTIFRYGVLLLGLFVILDSVWIFRNYRAKDKFTPLNDIDGYSKLSNTDPMPAIYIFLEAWGGDLENQRHWFEVNRNMDYKYRDTLLPDYIYTSQFNKDSLYRVKERVKFYFRTHNDSVVPLINNSLQRFTNSIRSEKPFLFYIGAGLINYKKMLMSGYCNYDQFNEDFGKLSFVTKLYRLTRAILFYLLFLIGALYSFKYLLSKNKDSLMKVLICIAHINLFYIAFFFRTAEFRYVLPSTLVFMCLAAILLNKLWDRFKKKTTSVIQ